jgi:DNA-binding transcriptional LysR family regulator
MFAIILCFYIIVSCILLYMRSSTRQVPEGLSVDQLAALVETARHGSIRAAAAALHVTEQGLRSRLLALEQRLGVPLYQKRRGPRRGPLLTPQGRLALPRAQAVLEDARRLRDLFNEPAGAQEVRVAASQYLAYYLLIDAVRRFHAKFSSIRIQLSTRTEQQIEAALTADPGIAMGFAAPYEASPELEYAHLFSMRWSFIAPRKHPLLKRARLRLKDLADEPLILFERGSTGRSHVVEAFQKRGVSPRVVMEATNTPLVVKMVAAGLGVSIVPLLAGGVVTRGMGVGAVSLGEEVEPIRSGVLTRHGEALSPAAQQFVAFVRAGLKEAT